jgi:aryl-alcohol dehydrogenase-like predicted oxidoreductase
VVTRRLGSQGPEVTPLGLGTWAMSGPYEFGWGPTDDAESITTIRHAFASGLGWIDTAAAYGFGHAEEVVGRALRELAPGEEVLVFTKCGRPWLKGPERTTFLYDLTPASIRAECERSLGRLGVERIDLYQFHWPDYGTGTPVEESWNALAELQDEGKVRWLGVCNFTVELLERIEPLHHVDSLQPPLSLINRHARRELIPWCERNGTGVIVYSPMGAGLLTGSFNRGRLERLAADDWRRRSPMFAEPKLSQNLALVERLLPIAERLGCDLPALAVAWTLAVPGVVGAIVGGRRLAQVDGWLPAADLRLSEADLAEIDQALEETGAGTDDPPTPPPAQAPADTVRTTR